MSNLTDLSVELSEAEEEIDRLQARAEELLNTIHTAVQDLNRVLERLSEPL